MTDAGAATAIINARVFDGETLRDWTSVRFDDGVITHCSTSSAAQDGDEVIDAAGGTVLPGLIDAHIHLVPGALAQSLSFGVTTVLDMFSTPELVAAARIQAATRSDVADVRSSSVGATAPGGHPSMMYPPFPTVITADQSEAFVDERIGEGADYLKLFSGRGGRWPALDAESIGTLVRDAHTRGLIVVAHVSSTAGVEEVVSAGADVIAHVPADVELAPALVDRIMEAGIAVVPTLTTIENNLRGSGAAALLDDPRLASMLSTASTDRLGAQVAAERHRAAALHSPAEGTVQRLADAGAVLLAGTDAPNPGTTFGASLHRELELLVRSGLSAPRALAAATSAPADTFGLTDRGRIETGRRADVILVREDPTLKITATRGIERMWRAGISCDRTPFVPTDAEVEQLDAFETRVAHAVATVRNRQTT